MLHSVDTSLQWESIEQHTAYSIQKHLTLHIWLYILHLGFFYTAHYELKSTSIFNSIPYLVAHFLSDVNERIKLTWEIAFISVKLFQFSGFLAQN